MCTPHLQQALEIVTATGCPVKSWEGKDSDYANTHCCLNIK